MNECEHCVRCETTFEPSDEMSPCGPYMGDWKWRKPTESEILNQMDGEGWRSVDEGFLCPDCCAELEGKGIYPEDWKFEKEFTEC